MDQKDLYQQSVTSNQIHRDFSPALISRDKFVIDHIMGFRGKDDLIGLFVRTIHVQRARKQ